MQYIRLLLFYSVIFWTCKFQSLGKRKGQGKEKRGWREKRRERGRRRKGKMTRGREGEDDGRRTNAA